MTQIVGPLIALPIVMLVLTGCTASPTSGSVRVALNGDTVENEYQTDFGVITSTEAKHTKLQVHLHWVLDIAYETPLAASVLTPGGKVTCTSASPVPPRRTGEGRADIEVLTCSTFISPDDLKTIKTVKLTDTSHSGPAVPTGSQT